MLGFGCNSGVEPFFVEFIRKAGASLLPVSLEGCSNAAKGLNTNIQKNTFAIRFTPVFRACGNTDIFMDIVVTVNLPSWVLLAESAQI